MDQIYIENIIKRVKEYISYELKFNVKKVKANELNTYCNYISYEGGIVLIYWHYAIEKITESLTRLAHELGHVELKHFLIKPDKDYRKRYKYEKAAWKRAIRLAKIFKWQFNKSIMKKYLNEYK